MKRNIIAFSTLLLVVAAPAWAARFEHRAHLEEYAKDVSCSSCHLHEAELIVPERKVCLDCHEQAFVSAAELPATRTHGPVWALQHREEAKSKTIDCAACHEQDYCLECHKSGRADEMGAFGNNMINVHRSDFHVSHPIAARTDPQLCSSCHENNFCVACHDDFRVGRSSGASHRRVFDLGLNGDIDAIHAGFTPDVQCDACHLQGSVAPDFHTWSVGHARDARKNLATCQSCHPDGDVCIKCHSARGGAVGYNPHGKDWDDRKSRLNDASNGKTCRKCH